MGSLYPLAQPQMSIIGPYALRVNHTSDNSIRVPDLIHAPSPVKVIHLLSFCYTTGLLHRHSEGGHHAGQSIRTFCGEKSYFRHGTWHVGTRPGSGATRCLVCPDGAEAVHPYLIVFDR